MARTNLFGHCGGTTGEGPGVPDDVPDLVGTTEPDPRDSVRAVIDLALLGGPGDGKTELAAAMIRTLRARAPELDPPESTDNRRALAAVMGGSPEPDAGDRMAHYTFRVPLATLVDSLGGLERAALLWRTGRLRAPLWPAAFLFAGAIAAAINLPLPLALVPPLAALGIIAFLVARGLGAAREQIGRAGDVELVLWDPPGARVEGERAAELYDRWAQLSRRRRAVQPPWRTYAFVPILLANPLRFTRSGSNLTARLRGLLPMFAALAGPRPRAVVAINRWSLITAACPAGSPRTGAASVRIEGDDSIVELDRAALTSSCIEAEDGHDGGLSLIHLRYDTGDASADAGEVIAYRDGSGGAVLGGAARRALAALLAELTLEGPPAEPAPAPAPAPIAAVPPAVADDRPTAVYRAPTAAPIETYDYRDNEYVPVPRALTASDNGVESPYQPRGTVASRTLAAMTEALDGRSRS